jgi:hypothetical protein
VIKIIYKLVYENQNGRSVEFSKDTNLKISSAAGFTENHINLSLSQGMGQIGSTVQGQAVQAKDMSFTGIIVGETSMARRQILRAIEPLTLARLIYNDEWEIEVYPTQTPVVEKYLTNAKFQFILKAPFPYWNRIEGHTTFLSHIEPVFEFPWDLSQPFFQFGGRREGLFGNVHNSGDIDAPYRVIFTALDNLSNPMLTNVITAETLRILTDMSAGEIITVDIRANGVSVTSNLFGVVTDKFGSLDIDSNLYRIRSGDNVIRYDAEPNRSGLDVMVLHNALRVGVYD